jgi:hypothetical protein
MPVLSGEDIADALGGGKIIVDDEPAAEERGDNTWDKIEPGQLLEIVESDQDDFVARGIGDSNLPDICNNASSGAGCVERVGVEPTPQPIADDPAPVEQEFTAKGLDV